MFSYLFHQSDSNRLVAVSSRQIKNLICVNKIRSKACNSSQVVDVYLRGFFNQNKRFFFPFSHFIKFELKLKLNL